MENITLIGMPGCGKSTIGVILAKVLGYQFVDSDLLIQSREGRLLHEIISKEGFQRFAQIEEEVNESITGKKQIIATGGSVIYGKKAMEHLRKISTIIYIKLPFSEIESRVGNIRKRGVLLKDNQDLKGLYDERCPLYEAYADITVDALNLSVEELMETIVNQLTEQKNEK